MIDLLASVAVLAGSITVALALYVSVRYPPKGRG